MCVKVTKRIERKDEEPVLITVFGYGETEEAARADAALKLLVVLLKNST